MGFYLENLLDQIENLETLGELNTIDEEEFAVQVVRLMKKVLDFMTLLEIYMVESWMAPRKCHISNVLEVLEGLVLTISAEADRELFGWRFTVFTEVGGQDLIRSLETRLTLLKQSRDVIKVVLKVVLDQNVSPHIREVLTGFVNTNAEWARRGILTENWFENTVNTLTRLRVQIQPEDLTGIYGLDLIAERGSSPERLSTPETLRGEVMVDASSDIVMVNDRELERFREEDEVSDALVSTPPPVLTSSQNTTPGSEQEDGGRLIRFTGGL